MGSMTLLGCGRPPSGAALFTAIINFRGTSGYVTDGANQTYCLADVSPTTRGGNTFGWQISGMNAVDRDNTLDPRFAGINFGGADFLFTLPRTGLFHVNYVLGDAGGFAHTQTAIVKDNTTTLLTGSSISTSGTQFADINNTIYSTSAAYIAGSVPLALTFATTSFVLSFSGTAVICSITITD